MQTLGPLAVRAKILDLDDSLGKAAEAVRASTIGAVPVVHHHRLQGLITAALLSAYLAEHGGACANTTSVRALDLEPAVSLPDSLTPQDALLFFEANDLAVAPVVDAGNGLLGMISRAELASAVCGRVRPPMVGGMATPFGVYLTAGNVRGGVGDWALICAGIFLSSRIFVAILLAQWLLDPNLWSARSTAIADWLGQLNPDGLVHEVAWIALGALFFRLSAVAGYHAAEHQVVHTIEAGDELQPEVVRAKPRVHPRCGTNLVVGMMILGFFWHHLDFLKDFQPLPAVLIILFFWRRLGGVAQQYVTTRPASPKQLESGIYAAKDLIKRYQSAPRAPLPVWKRIWNMGLIQVMLGYAIVQAAVFILSLFFPALRSIAL